MGISRVCSAFALFAFWIKQIVRIFRLRERQRNVKRIQTQRSNPASRMWINSIVYACDIYMHIHIYIFIAFEEDCRLISSYIPLISRVIARSWFPLLLDVNVRQQCQRWLVAFGSKSQREVAIFHLQNSSRFARTRYISGVRVTRRTISSTLDSARRGESWRGSDRVSDFARETYARARAAPHRRRRARSD